MGTYYHFAVVHGRILVWWTDGEGAEHERWIDGPAAADFAAMMDGQDFRQQQALRDLLGTDGETS